MVVEGAVDEAVARLLIVGAGGHVGDVFGRKGKAYIRSRLAGFNSAALHTQQPWLVLIDLDLDHACPVPLRQDLLPAPAETLCFRVAVKAIEAWLLADRVRISEFFHVALSQVPPDPEAVPDPKQTLVNLCRRSRSRDVREAMVPTAEGRRTVGPGYTSMVEEFVGNPNSGWRVDVACRHSESLQRAVHCIQQLVRTT